MIAARLIVTVLAVLILRTPARGGESLIVVTAEGAGVLTVVARGVPKSVKLPGRPHNLALSPDGKQAWVTDASSSKVWAVSAHEDDALLEVFDAERLTPLGRLNLPVRPHNVAVSPDGRAAWLTTLAAGRLLVVELETIQLLGQVDVKGSPHDLAFTPDGREVWVTPSLASEHGPLDPAWKALIERMADRFLMGIDVWAPRLFEPAMLDRLIRWTRRVLGQLKPEVATRVAATNAATVFRIKESRP